MTESDTTTPSCIQICFNPPVPGVPGCVPIRALPTGVPAPAPLPPRSLLPDLDLALAAGVAPAERPGVPVTAAGRASRVERGVARPPVRRVGVGSWGLPVP